MRRTITLNPNEEYPFDIGRNALIMIIRNTTQNVIFRGDSLTPIELSRSDIVHVNEFRNQRMFLTNDNATPITVEFQLSDTLISIREQRMSVDGGIVVNEIATPVQVSEISAPVSVAGVVPVNVQGVVDVAFPPDVAFAAEVVNFPSVQAIKGSVAIEGGVAIGNFPDVQVTEDKPTQFNPLPSITLDATGHSEISANPRRKGLMVQADENNTASVIIAGCIRVKPDGFAMIPASNALSIQGENGDVITIGEVV